MLLPIPSAGGGAGELVGGLDATVRTALIDVGLVGWSVPALVLTVPGILVVIVVALQLIGGAAWLPIARRMLSRTSSPRSGARADRRRKVRRTGR